MNEGVSQQKMMKLKAIKQGYNLKIEEELNLADGEEIIISINEFDEFDIMRQQAKENGYDSREKIMDLISQVKLAMLEEKGRSK